MQLFAYKNTMAGAKRIVQDIQPPKLSGRERLAQISLDWQRRQAERAEEEEKRRERIRIQVAAEKAKWAKKLENVGKIVVQAPHYIDLIERVAAWHGYTLDDIFSLSKTDRVVAARCDAMAAVWLNCRLEGKSPTLLSMSRAFKRDHTTVLFSLRKSGVYSPQSRGQPRKGLRTAAQ
jgi:hypothetical protein